MIFGKQAILKRSKFFVVKLRSIDMLAEAKGAESGL